MIGAAAKLGTRFAGDSLKWLFKGMGPAEIATRLTPDVIGMGVEMAYTPGDFGDKVIAGLGSGIGGSTGGLLLGKVGGTGALGTALDFAGSIGGDMLGRNASEVAMRGKDKLMGGKGQTPYEKMGEQQQLEMMQAGRTQVLAELGLLPGSYQEYLVDPSTGMGVS